MFDTGGSREVSEYIPNTAQTVAMPYLRKCGVKTVQGVFLSHGDGDHSGGLLAFRDQIGIETVFYNPKTIAQERIQQCLMDWEQNGNSVGGGFGGRLCAVGRRLCSCAVSVCR